MAPYICDSFKDHYTDPNRLCPMLGFCPKYYKKMNITKYVEEILADKPKNNTWPIPTGKNIKKVIHFTDIHTDLEYIIGSNVTCDEPLCCRPY